MFNKYSVDWIMNNREQLESEVQDYLAKTLEDEGYTLTQLTSGFTPPASIQAGIEEKNRRVQEAEAVKNDLETTKMRAQKLIIEAEANTRVAEELNKQNKLKAQSLSPLLIQDKFIERWDGHTPLYGTSPVLFKNP